MSTSKTLTKRKNSITFRENQRFVGINLTLILCNMKKESKIKKYWVFTAFYNSKSKPSSSKNKSFFKKKKKKRPSFSHDPVL